MQIICILLAISHLHFVHVGISDDGEHFSKTSWSVYNGDRQSTHYSTLDEINRHNVKNLRPGWIYEFRGGGSGTTIQCNPVIFKNFLYITSPIMELVCLEADTGKEIWSWDPVRHGGSRGVNRGVTLWWDKDGNVKRLFMISGIYLFALDPESGAMIESFGVNGRVDLRKGLDRDWVTELVTCNTPGVIYNDLFILGSRVGEGPGRSAPGHVRAFDVHTGERKWIFHTIPHPGEPGYETWPPDAWKSAGGANAWGGFSLDARSGRVYFGTGSASYDHFGGNRIGANLFANCVVALDAQSGAYQWHFQTVHHDLWDYDLPCPPVLVDLKIGGKDIEALAQVTKVGHTFVLRRDNGQPVFEVEERPVPQSDIPGEESWPTQPFPKAPPAFAQQEFTAAKVAELSPESAQWIRERLGTMRTGGVFLPPGIVPSVVLPQFNGGAEWGGPAVDPETGILYVNASNEAEWISMRPSQPVESITSFQLGSQIVQSMCSNCHGNPIAATQFPEKPPTSLESVAHRMSRPEVESILTAGRGAMPGFGYLLDVERKAITDFIFASGKNVHLQPGELDAKWKDEIPYQATGHHDFRDPDGYPVNPRPWGTLTALNLNQGTMLWQVALGTYPELERRGFPPTGTFNIGGPIVTAGGLVFIGATMDERFRAFDKDSGDNLWEFQLDAGAYATPATYSCNGKQWIAIAAGGGGKPGTRSGNKLYAFTLP